MLLLLILGAVAFTKIKSSNNKGLTYSSSREVVQSSSSDMEKVSENEKKFSEALATLEKSDKEITDDTKINTVYSAIETAQNSMLNLSNMSEVKGNIDNKLAMTDSSMVLTFAIICRVNNYRLSKVDVYESKSDDVLQFVATFESDGKDNCYLSGNYNTYADSLQIASYHGGEVGATFG